MSCCSTNKKPVFESFPVLNETFDFKENTQHNIITTVALNQLKDILKKGARNETCFFGSFASLTIGTPLFMLLSTALLDTVIFAASPTFLLFALCLVYGGGSKIPYVEHIKLIKHFNVLIQRFIEEPEDSKIASIIALYEQIKSKASSLDIKEMPSHVVLMKMLMSCFKKETNIQLRWNELLKATAGNFQQLNDEFWNSLNVKIPPSSHEYTTFSTSIVHVPNAITNRLITTLKCEFTSNILRKYNPAFYEDINDDKKIELV